MHISLSHLYHHIKNTAVYYEIFVINDNNKETLKKVDDINDKTKAVTFVIGRLAVESSNYKDLLYTGKANKVIPRVLIQLDFQ